MHTCCCESEKDSLWREGNEPGGKEKEINRGKFPESKNSVLICKTVDDPLQSFIHKQHLKILEGEFLKRRN